MEFSYLTRVEERGGEREQFKEILLMLRRAQVTNSRFRFVFVALPPSSRFVLTFFLCLSKASLCVVPLWFLMFYSKVAFFEIQTR